MAEHIRWDRWRPFPTMAKVGFGNVPIGPGVIWLRNRVTGQEVFIGASNHVAQDLPKMLLRSSALRRTDYEPVQLYVTTHAPHIELRTVPSATTNQAMRLAERLRAENACLF